MGHSDFLQDATVSSRIMNRSLIEDFLQNSAVSLTKTPQVESHETGGSRQTSLLFADQGSQNALEAQFVVKNTVLLSIACLGAFILLAINVVGIFVCKGYFKKKAIPMPTCLSAAYPQSLSHLRRNRYSNLLQRFSLESQPESLLLSTAHHDHFLSAGAVSAMTPLTLEQRRRSTSCYDAPSSARTLKVNSLPLSNVPEVIIVDESSTCLENRRKSPDSRAPKKKAWRERLGQRRKSKDGADPLSRPALGHCSLTRGSTPSPEVSGGSSCQLQPGVSTLSASSSSSSVNAFK